MTAATQIETATIKALAQLAAAAEIAIDGDTWESFRRNDFETPDSLTISGATFHKIIKVFAAIDAANA